MRVPPSPPWAGHGSAARGCAHPAQVGAGGEGGCGGLPACPGRDRPCPPGSPSPPQRRRRRAQPQTQAAAAAARMQPGITAGRGQRGLGFYPPPSASPPPPQLHQRFPAGPPIPARQHSRSPRRSVGGLSAPEEGGGKQGDAFAAVFPPPALSVPGGAVMWSRECRAKPSPGRSDRHKPLAGALAAAHCPGKPEQPLPAPGNPSSSPRRCPGLPRSKVSGGASLLPPAEGCGLGLF